jgi:hypothetical protein
MTEDIFERAGSDDGFRARLAAAYTGREELSRALWWYVHPELAAPDGSESPAARIRALEGRLFSRDAALGGSDEAADSAELASLRRNTRHDRDAVARAIDLASRQSGTARMHPRRATRSAEDSGSASSPGAALRPSSIGVEGDLAGLEPRGREPHGFESHDLESHDLESHDRETTRATSGGRAVRSRWAVAAAAGLAGLLLGGGVATAAAVQGAFDQPPSAASGVPSNGSGPDGGSGPGLSVADAGVDDGTAATAIPIEAGDYAEHWALDALDRPQEPGDLPPSLLTTSLEPASFRSLGLTAPLYAARDLEAHACLVLVQEDGGYTSDCVDDAGFPMEGLRVGGIYRRMASADAAADPAQGTVSAPSTSDAAVPPAPSSLDAENATSEFTYSEIDVTWMPSGQLDVVVKPLVSGWAR